jgi:hypothetical protein
MKHYVYKVTDKLTGQYYFGSRSHICPENDEYMGSMKTWIPEDKHRLVKQIIRDDFETREIAIKFESEIIGKHINDNLNENYHIPNYGFHTFGNVEIAKKISKANKGKLPWNFGKTNVYNNDTLKKMSKSAEGRIVTDEIKKKIGKSNKGKLSGSSNPMYGKFGELNPNYGNKWSLEQRKIQSEKLKKSSNPAYKQIIQLSKNGEFIREWGSIKEAANFLNINISGISSCLSGRYLHSGGYKWEYKFNSK